MQERVDLGLVGERDDVGPVEEREDQPRRVKDGLPVRDRVRKLVPARFRVVGRAVRALILLAAERLDLGNERLGVEKALVVGLDRKGLVVERLEEVLGVLFCWSRRQYGEDVHDTPKKGRETDRLAPDAVPLAVRALPLFVLLLQPREHDRDGDARVLVQRLDDFESLLLAIYLLDHALVDTLALVSEPRFQAERSALVRLHERDAGRDRFEQRDRAQVRLDVVVVLVSFLLGPVQRRLVRVLVLVDKALVRLPRRLRDWLWKRRESVSQSNEALRDAHAHSPHSSLSTSQQSASRPEQFKLISLGGKRR